MLTTFAPVIVRPQAASYELLLTATTPVSHHDPAVQEDSNRTLFNRQKHLLVGPQDQSLPDQATVDRLSAHHPVPVDAADLLADLAFPEFLATALARVFLDVYNGRNGGDGDGLFAGMERYTRLETRLRMAAIGAPTLRTWWDRLCATLQVGIHPGDVDALLLELLTVPRGLQQAVLRVLTDDYRSIVALARLWHTSAKMQHEDYALKAGQAVAPSEQVTLAFSVEAVVPGSQAARVLEVPAVSGNSLRHQVVREPSWLHLCGMLDLQEGTPGQGPLLPGAEAIFYNGGNIRAGAKQPENTYGLATRIRAAFPSLDLLGGVTDSFDLGESRLQVGAWLVCRENAGALDGSEAASLPAASVSAFDLLDDVTLTRQAGTVGVGQMIYSFETLCAGAQVLLRLSLSPGTPPLTRGALVAAVETYLGTIPTVGGQAARGFGHVKGAWLRWEPGARLLRDTYEAYVEAHRDELRAGLIDGTLCSGRPVVS